MFLYFARRSSSQVFILREVFFRGFYSSRGGLLQEREVEIFSYTVEYAFHSYVFTTPQTLPVAWAYFMAALSNHPHENKLVQVCGLSRQLWSPSRTIYRHAYHLLPFYQQTTQMPSDRNTRMAELCCVLP